MQLVQKAIDDVEEGLDVSLLLNTFKIFSTATLPTEFVFKKCSDSYEFFNNKENGVEVTHEWCSFEDFNDINSVEMTDFMSIDENINI